MKMNFGEFIKSLFNPLSHEQFQRRAKAEGSKLGHHPTPEHGSHNPAFTKHYAHESKARRKMAAESRRINRGK